MLTKNLKKLWRMCIDTIEIYLSAFSFLVMFVAFILQIFTRYILGFQIGWTYEATVIGFMWVVAFGGSYASRLREHVSFSMFYDKMTERGRAWTDIVSNVFIVVTFIVMLAPVLDFVDFMKIKKTAVMKVPLSILYAPFIYFIVSSTIYIIRDTLTALQIVGNRESKKEPIG